MARRTTKRPEQISVFISYVSEDRELAASFEAELLQLFAVSASLPPVSVFRDVGSIGKGSDYRTVITNALNAADILLVVLTDRLKPSFAFPGFEVGFFARSLDERPKIYGNIDRKILPVCIGADSPSTLDYLQAIKVDEDQIVKVSTQSTGAGLPGGSSNPVFALLANISETADAVLGKRGGAGGGVSKQDEQWRQKLTTSAARLNNSIQAYLESPGFIGNISGAEDRRSLRYSARDRRHRRRSLRFQDRSGRKYVPGLRISGGEDPHI
jgi:hypothetical protein